MTEAIGTRAGAASIVVAQGARAVEKSLLGDAEALADQAASDPSLLATPVWVVVPSRSLRAHVAACLVARHGRALAGVHVMTLHGLAAEIAARAGKREPRGGALFPLLVQRSARREAVLHAGLDALQDGYAALVGTVRDLLDAGYEPAHAEALDERLAELASGGGDGAVERARALVRVAAAVASEMERLGIGRPADTLRRATESLKTDADAALPARAVLIHGFAEATGVASDLLEALLRHRSARLYLDEPPDPARPEKPDLGVAFARRLRERAEGVATVDRRGGEHAAPEIELFRAPGAYAEAREVAERVRTLLEGGARPEAIGVVARGLGPYQTALQQHFSRLGIPFSVAGTPGSWGGGARRVQALVELLRQHDTATVDAWLAARDAPDAASLDLRVGLRACGATRLSDVVALDVRELLNEAGGLPLPIRRGFVGGGDGEDEDAERGSIAPRRVLAGRDLHRAVSDAAKLGARLAAWPANADFASHLGLLRSLLAGELSWRPEFPGGEETERALAKLEEEVPPSFLLGRDEFVLLVARALEHVGRESPGGRGGGVQVLGVVEARSRTFERLFVLGLNRDSFPRLLTEDPLLPDRLRGALAAVLPDIPIKRTGFDEERYLFAQLVSASPHVTLSWQASDDDGKARPPSPLVERVRLARGLPDVPLVADIFSAGSLAAGGRPRPAHEHAVLAGLFGTRGEFAAVLPVALAEARGASGADELAAARVAVLEELDPDRGTEEGRRRRRALGPYLGFVGERRRGDRRGRLSITRAEELAGCPWQVFLRHLLALEPAPDPLGALPEASPPAVGELVHRVLERIVREAVGELPETLEEALATVPRPVSWPADGAFERILAEEASAVSRRTGLSLPGLRHALVELARPHLTVARETDWGGGQAVPVTGAELAGEVHVHDAGGRARTIPFKADRVERLPGGVRLTDYKTGTPISEGKLATTRRRNFLVAVGRGARLQAVAYALAAGHPAAQGRYLFLRPDAAPEAREYAVSTSDGDFTQAFAGVVAAVLGAWDQGAFFPRILEPNGRDVPRRCGSCEVREACVQDDTGACRRLAEWAAAHADEAVVAGEVRIPGAAEALLAAWRLAEKPARGGRGGRKA